MRRDADPCRADGHAWDVPAPAMFQPVAPIRVVSTCTRCGWVRVYDHGDIQWHLGAEHQGDRTAEWCPPPG